MWSNKKIIMLLSFVQFLIADGVHINLRYCLAEISRGKDGFWFDVFTAAILAVLDVQKKGVDKHENV